MGVILGLGLWRVGLVGEHDGLAQATDVVTAQREVLDGIQPEVQVVNGTLLVAHKQVEGPQIDGRTCFSVEDLVQRGQTLQGRSGGGHKKRANRVGVLSQTSWEQTPLKEAARECHARVNLSTHHPARVHPHARGLVYLYPPPLVAGKKSNYDRPCRGPGCPRTPPGCPAPGCPRTPPRTLRPSPRVLPAALQALRDQDRFRGKQRTGF